jgi:hypothetical protein
MSDSQPVKTMEKGGSGIDVGEVWPVVVSFGEEGLHAWIMPPSKTPLLERVLSQVASTPALFLFKRHYSQPKSRSESNTRHVTSFMSFADS